MKRLYNIYTNVEEVNVIQMLCVYWVDDLHE